MITRIGLSLFWFFAASEAVLATQPWDRPFSGNTGEILKAAAALPVSEKAEILYLLQDRHYQIQSDGTTNTTFRCVYRIAKESAVEDWAEVEQEWEPWHENKPELRARVISADGSIHWLDPKTIADAPSTQFDATIFSDSRVVRAPLPAVDSGAVIEYEIVEQENSPLFAAGVTRDLSVGGGSPIERFHVSIDAAQGISVKTAFARLDQPEIVRSESKGGSHIEVEVGRQNAPEFPELFAPSGLAVYPSFRFSSGTSWRQVASVYEQIVNERISRADTKAAFAALGIDFGKLPANTLDRAAAISARLQQNVRYTGVEFGQAAIVPNAPADVIQRHYGDCKDKAALLVALLKAAGLDAHLALLNAGSRTDVDPDLPGLGQFNHAIVFLNDAKPLWIDATAESTRVGDLPQQDQGRRALIVAGSTSELTTTPEASSKENRVIYNVEFHLLESGKGDVHLDVEAYGSFESELRSIFGGDGQQVRTALESFAKRAFRAKSLGASNVTPRADFSKPFHMTVEALESDTAISDTNEAAVGLSNALLLERLPYLLLNAAADPDEKKRVNDFVFAEPYQATVNFKIFPPRGASPRPLPTVADFKSGDFTFRSETKRHPGGIIELSYFLDTGKRRLTPDEYTDLRKHTTKLAGTPMVVAFTFKSGDLLALGKSAEALRVARQDMNDHAQDVAAYLRYARLSMDCGAGERALAVAQQAVELAPKSAEAWLTLGTLNEYDSFGRLHGHGWKPAEAEKALRHALELDAANPEISLELAILLEFDSSGQRYVSSARLPEAVAVYRQILAKSPNAVVSQNLVFALLHLGQYKEAREEAASALAAEPVFPALNVALTALIDGSERAIIDSQSGIGDEARAVHLSDGGRMLLLLRNYQQASELFKAAQRLSSNPQIASLIPFAGKTKHYESSLASKDDPKRPVQLLLASIASAGSPDSALAAILSTRANLSHWHDRVMQARENFAPFAQMFLATGGSADVLPDLLATNADLTVRGTGNPAYLVDLNTRFNVRLSSVVVVKENGECKLLAPADGLDIVGKLALEKLDKGDLAGAQAWLDQVKDSALPILASDEKGPAFRYLWAGIAPETRNSGFIRAAAASLLGTYSGDHEAIKILRASTEHPVAFMDRKDLYFALCEAFRRGQQWQELLEASRLLAKNAFYAEVAYRLGAEAHIHLQQWHELQIEAEARLHDNETKRNEVVTVTLKPGQPPVNRASHNAEDGWALHFAALGLMQQGRFQDAQALIEREKNAPFPSFSGEREFAADWNAILSGKTADAEGHDTDNGSGRFLEQDPPHLYTRAMTLLIADNASECKKTLANAIDEEEGGPGLSSAAWLVQGEMLKRYGLDADANTAFAKAKQLNDWRSLPMARFLLEREESAAGKR